MARNLLIVADDCFDNADDVPEWLRDKIESFDRVTVVAPIIGNRFAVLADDEALHVQAENRAAFIVGELQKLGVEAEGRHSTAGPYEAVTDELRSGSYEGVVVGLVDGGHWREKRLVERLREATEIPISEVVVARPDR